MPYYLPGCSMYGHDKVFVMVHANSFTRNKCTVVYGLMSRNDFVLGGFSAYKHMCLFEIVFSQCKFNKCTFKP